MGLTQKAKGKLIGRVMTEAMPNGATPKAYAGTVKSKPAANGLRTVLNFQRVGSQRYFDAAGFPGRTLGLDAEGQTEDGGEIIAARMKRDRWATDSRGTNCTMCARDSARSRA